jgi:hypothetical protein
MQFHDPYAVHQPDGGQQQYAQDGYTSYEDGDMCYDEVPEPEYQAPPGDPIHSGAQGPTKALSLYQDSVLSEKHGDQASFKVIKELGRGGFGVVSLCQRIGPDVHFSRLACLCCL